MSFLIECMFGKNRDVFVSITLLIALGLMYPYTIIDGHEVFLASLAVICTGCLIHLLLFFMSYNEPDTKYDKGYFVSISLIFIGDFAYFMSGIDSTCNEYEPTEDAYRECWWTGFMINLALFFMTLYLNQIILINRFENDFTVKQWFNNDRFRLFYLIFCNCLAIIVFALYVQFYFDDYSRAFRVWHYTSIFLNVMSIIIALIISYTNKGEIKTESGNIHRRYSPLYTWWIINVFNCIFGSAAFWGIKDSVSDGLFDCGQFIMWSAWNVWLLTEAFVPINVNERNPYQMIEV